MSTITLPNIRVSSDLTIRLKLKDGGVAIDWSTLQNIRVSLYADDQRSMASRCSVSIDEEDSTILVCQYAANKMQYLGVNRVIVQCKYLGEVKTYDKPAFTFVRWTADQNGEQITIDDPDVDVEISVEDISSSILQEAVDAAFGAADRANDAAAAAEHMVDIHTGPEGKSAYEVAVENGYVGTEEEWLASLEGPVGVTPDISIGTVTTVEPGTPAAASMTGTPEAPVLNLSIPKGLVGATPNFTVGTVTTGEPGSSVIVTITGTPEAPVLNLTIPQGMQGNTGSSVEYPYELVNNLTTNDATKGLSAAQGYVLDGKVSQLQQKVAEIQDTDPDFEITDENGAAIIKIDDGTITTKNFNSDDAVKTDTTKNFDFAVSDDEDFVIFGIKDGNIKTKNFDSTEIIKPEDTSNYDFAISDEDGNVVLAIEDGHIKTKNFDSENIEPEEEINLDPFRSKTGLMYSKFFNLSTDVSDLVITGNDNNVTADGIYLSGDGNVILNKYFSLANRTVEYLCKFTESSISVFTTDQGGPVIKVDMVAHKFSISNNGVLEEIAIDTGIESHLFKVLITKNYQEQIAKLVDVTVNKVYTVSKTQDGEGGAGQGSLNPTPTIIGMQSDKYKFYETNDSFYIKNIKIYSNVNNVKLIMYGDSITEPEAYYPKENFRASWTQLVISQVNGEAVSSGRSGTNIDAIISRISNELPYINAKYVMVTIGTNGGNTVEKLRQLVDYIKSCGATPILNNIPCNDNNGTSNTVANNQMIQQVRTEKGIKGCLFNVATSENGDGETLDYSMMYWEDYPNLGTWYHHPNPKGAEAMFLRTFVDVPEIYN